MKQISKIKISLIFLIILMSPTGLFIKTAYSDESKWIAIGMLHNWYSSAGCEMEVGRRHLIPDQQDGLRWPALFEYQDMQAAKALWIGATDYDDPITGQHYDYKVVDIGTRVLDESNEIFPQKFIMIGKAGHPLVMVDGTLSSHTVYMDEVNEIDPSLPVDREIFNTVNTSIGISMKRTIYAVSQQYHENYFIYDHVFTNTGIYNKAGATNQQTLNDVVFMWQFRYAVSMYVSAYGYQYAPQSASWGHNTVNDILHPFYGDDIRAIYAWHGLHSTYGCDNIGGPNIGSSKIAADGFLGAAQFPGIIVLHADKSATDKNDDMMQPFSTPYFSSDATFTSAGSHSQFSASGMAIEYGVMAQGMPARTHAQKVGTGFANLWTPSASETNPGGFSQAIAFGPYDMAPGDSIHIVFAEGVNGLSRDECKRVGNQWYNQITPYIKPDGSTAANRDDFKDAWVFTGKDSIRKTFMRAKSNWENGFNYDTPPPPPETFMVNSGGDRISLTWSASAESYQHFGGYKVYRAIHKPDTTFDLIYECGQGTDNPVVNLYDDKTALRGFDYYYYITTYDDGMVNTIDPGRLIESNLFWTRTTEPAYLRRPAGTALSQIRIVPNPYNIRAKDYQFGESAPDRIMFFNIPPRCLIKIFTESGELVNTIQHTNRSGDESWNLITSSRQVIVSGLYVAYFEVTDDYVDPNTGNLLFKKGESTFQKFIVIR